MVPVFVWSSRQASPGRAVDAPADASLTPRIGVTSAGTEATTPMTATALAREEAVAAGEGLLSVDEVVAETLDTCSDENSSGRPVPQRQSGINEFVFVSGPILVLDLAQGPGPVGAVISLAPAAVAPAGM